VNPSPEPHRHCYDPSAGLISSPTLCVLALLLVLGDGCSKNDRQVVEQDVPWEPGTYTLPGGQQVAVAGPKNVSNGGLDPTTDWTSPTSTAHGTGASANCDSNHPWADDTNVKSSDNNRATVHPGNGNFSDCVAGYNWGFALPTGSEILGVEARIEKCSSSNKYVDKMVSVLSALYFIGNNKAHTSTPWPNPVSSETYVTYGGSTDLWGLSWTSAGVNSSTWGIGIGVLQNGTTAADAQVDHIQVRIYYNNPTATVTQTVTNTVPTNTPTRTATNTATVTNTVPTNTPTQTATNTVPTNTPTVTNTVPTNTPTKTNTVPTNTPTVTNTVPTNTPTVTRTETPTPTFADTATVTNTPTVTDTVSPTATDTPSVTETPTQTVTETVTQTETATNTPTPPPTFTETATVTDTPTATPTIGGCCVPSGAPGCANSASCNDCVCGLDPYCCNVQWDDLCAKEAGAACGTSCSCTPPTPAAGSTPTATPNAPCPQIDLGDAVPTVVTGATTDQGNFITDASCSDGGYRSPEVTYRWTAPADGTYVIDVWGSFNSIVSVRDGNCAGAELACAAAPASVPGPEEEEIEMISNLDGSSAGGEIARAADPAFVADPEVEVTLITGQTIAIIVDGEWGESGTYTLSIQPGPPTPTPTDTPTPTETPTPRNVIIQTPADGSFFNSTPVQVTGQVFGTDTVIVNGVTATIDGTTFTASVDLVEGSNTITASATGGSDTVHVTLDTTPPAAPAAGLIAVDVGAATVIGLPGSVEANGVVTVTNTRTGQTAAANAEDAGAFAAMLAAQAGDTLSIFVTDRAGNVGPPAIKQVSTLTLTITQPAAGATIIGDRVDVRGTLSLPPNATVGVTVNGVPALVESGQFVAQVSIDSSLTSLTAIARDFTGALSAVSIAVTPQPGPEPPVRLTATRPAGLVPVTTSFRLSSLVGIQQVTLDADGNGTVEFQEPSFNETFTFTYAQPGMYTPQVTVTDVGGNVYTATAIVQVSDPVAMDARLQPVWQGVKDALRAGDITTAAQYIHSRYTAAYQAMWLRIPQAALIDVDPIMTSIQLVDVGYGNAEYEMLRDEAGETFSYGVWFELDQDGLWRIRAF
jgi:hypothetical protein